MTLGHVKRFYQGKLRSVGRWSNPPESCFLTREDHAAGRSRGARTPAGQGLRAPAEGVQAVVRHPRTPVRITPTQKVQKKYLTTFRPRARTRPDSEK